MLSAINAEIISIISTLKIREKRGKESHNYNKEKEVLDPECIRCN